MPVVPEHQNAASLQAAANSTSTSSASSTYLFLSLAILLTLGVSISRRLPKKSAGIMNPSSQSFSQTKAALSNARMTQETASASSALPEKPYLQQKDSIMEHQQQRSTSDTGNQQQPPPFSPQPQSFQSHEDLQQRPPARTLLSNHQHAHPFHQTLLGSQPTATTPLLHPQPPSPTLTMAPNSIRIQTQILHPDENQRQRQHQQHQQQNQHDGQPQAIPGQYTQNEITFVPSPTEYASFEALYSKYPPKIYDSPNPASYASTTFSPEPQESALPRRRSYMKTLSNGIEVSGEITVGLGAEGGGGGQWRRHTRVFGGGVCMACEESERRRLTV